MADLRRSALITSRLRRGHSKNTDDSSLNPIPWKVYFDKKEVIKVRNGTFTLYRRGYEGVPIICLHGGGYSGLTWALFAKEITHIIDCQVFALDLRGHGQSKTENDDDMSLENLAADVDEIADKVFDMCQKCGVLVGHSMGGAVAVEVAKKNKSVRGAILIDVVEGPAMDALSSMPKLLRSRPSEFSSMEEAIAWSRKSGQTRNMLAARVSMPGQIVNYRSGKLAAEELEDNAQNDNVQNNPQANVAGPSRATDGIAASDITCIAEESEADVNGTENTRKREGGAHGTNRRIGKPPKSKLKKVDLENDKVRLGVAIAERLMDAALNSNSDQEAIRLHNSQTAANEPTNIIETEDDDEEASGSVEIPEPKPVYKWRTNLEITKPFWPGWFFGLSNKFLEIECPKLLLLARLSGLDTTLTVGQMQGKFQLEIFPSAGHTIQEDEPQRCAQILATFLCKHQICVVKEPINQ